MAHVPRIKRNVGHHAFPQYFVSDRSDPHIGNFFPCTVSSARPVAVPLRVALNAPLQYTQRGSVVKYPQKSAFYLPPSPLKETPSTNVRCAKRTNPKFAEDFATAHESKTEEGDSKTMDLSNNAAGRRIFRENPTKTDSQLAEIIRSGWRWEHRPKNVTFDEGRIVYMR